MIIEFRKFIGEYDWGWVNQQVQILRSEDTGGIMAIDTETNSTVGAVIFDNWTPNAVQAHIMFTNPLLLRHGFLEECFEFAFRSADRKMMIGIVKSDNLKAQKLDEHIGFEEQYRLKDGHADGVDLIYYMIHRDNCRFLTDIKMEAVNE